MKSLARKRAAAATPLAALTLGALALGAMPAGAQEQAANSQPPAVNPHASADADAGTSTHASPRITLIELTPHLAVNDAAALIEAENYGDAVTLLDDFIANHPEPVPEAFYLLALAHYQLGEYDKARPPAERAVTLAEDAPGSWLELVVDLMKRADDYRAALPWLERLIETVPGNKTYWLELSLAYERVGDLDRALATMRLAHTVEILTDDADFRRLADLLINRGLPLQSAEVLEAALESQTMPADEATYTQLGTAWFTAGEIDKAVAPLEHAARVSNTGDAHVRLAVVHVAREDWTAAIAALHAGFGRGSLSDEGQANLLMGVSLYRQQQFDESRTWFEQAAESARHRPMAEEYLRALDEIEQQARAAN
jgi:tetratricopeptide (TPR) repeat protein